MSQTMSRKQGVKASFHRALEKFSKQPKHKKIIISIFAVTALTLLGILLVKLLSPKPKSYEDYLKTIEQVQEVDRRASENSAVFRSLEEQLGKERYEKSVLGIDDKTYSDAVDHQIEAITKVQINNAQTEVLGGISTPEQLEQFRSDNPPSSVAQKAVDSRIAMAKGRGSTENLADALYVPIDSN